ncbi:30S ribosomal protein S6 [Candidatus Gracilibacteria bacterium]|nr:30S ribosomal protein S6 [Candidatus Gracilibacteria bacterium]
MEETPVLETTSYEIMVMLLPDLGDGGSEKELNEVRELITSGGGKIIQEDIWGVRELAYRIKKQDRGFYAVINFEMDPSKVKAFDKPLNINQAVLRYMVTKTPKHYEFRTMEQYEAESAANAAEEAAKKEEKEKSKSRPAKKPEAKPKKVEKKPEVAKEEPKVEPKEEKKAPAKVSKAKEEEADEKLKSIIDDPDISL